MSEHHKDDVLLAGLALRHICQHSLHRADVLQTGLQLALRREFAEVWSHIAPKTKKTKEKRGGASVKCTL